MNTTQTHAVCSNPAFVGVLLAGAGASSVAQSASVAAAGLVAKFVGFVAPVAANGLVCTNGLVRTNEFCGREFAGTNEKGPAHSPGLRQFGCGGRI